MEALFLITEGSLHNRPQQLRRTHMDSFGCVKLSKQKIVRGRPAWRSTCTCFIRHACLGDHKVHPLRGCRRLRWSHSFIFCKRTICKKTNSQPFCRRGIHWNCGNARMILLRWLRCSRRPLCARRLSRWGEGDPAWTCTQLLKLLYPRRGRDSSNSTLSSQM